MVLDLEESNFFCSKKNPQKYTRHKNHNFTKERVVIEEKYGFVVCVFLRIFLRTLKYALIYIICVE